MAAQKLNFEGVTLPVDLGRGMILRLSDDEETETLSTFLGTGLFAPRKIDGRYVCLQREPEFADEKQWPMRVRPALALLPDEIIFHAETPRLCRLADGQMSVSSVMRRGGHWADGVYEASNFLTTTEVIVDEATLRRVRALQEYPLDADPFMRSFGSAHNSKRNSEFRFVTYMSIVEGLIGHGKGGREIRENISKKMTYFYKFIWPTLKLAEGLPQPRFPDGREIKELDGAWSDLYKIRNMVAHGQGDELSWGKKLSECKDGFSTLQSATRGDAANLLDYGVKSLLYWHFERPDEQQCFSGIT